MPHFEKDVTDLDHVLLLSDKRRREVYILLVESLLIAILLIVWHWKLTLLQILPLVATITFLIDNLTHKSVQTMGISFLIASILKSIILIGLLIFYSTHLEVATENVGIGALERDESRKNFIMWVSIPCIVFEILFVFCAVSVIDLSQRITKSVDEPLRLSPERDFRDSSSSTSEIQPLNGGEFIDDDPRKSF